MSDESANDSAQQKDQALTLRCHPACQLVPYALDLQAMGLHCVLPDLEGPISHYCSLLSFLAVLEGLTCPSGVRREQEVIRIAWTSGTALGRVYDIPTTPGWAVFQKAAKINIYLASLLGSNHSFYRIPKDLSSFDDVRPDLESLPEVLPYTELASILYEALDCLMVSARSNQQDIHLRNLYPHAIWSSGSLFSQSQVRLLAHVGPPPRVFSRFLECPVRGELLAVPREVQQRGWIVFHEALVPTFLSGGTQYEAPGMERFVPRSSMSQTPRSASLIVADLTFAELYYLVRIEELASKGLMKAVCYEMQGFDNTSLGLMNEFLDKIPFCESRGIRTKRPEGVQHGLEKKLAERAMHDNMALAYAEQAACEALSTDEYSESSRQLMLDDSANATLVYKRDGRLDFACLDGYDGWTDEELIVKKHKAWIKYTPSVLLPAEIVAMYLERGIRFYVVQNVLRIVKASHTTSNRHEDDDFGDIIIQNSTTWTDLRAKLVECEPRLKHGVDRLLLHLVTAGQARLFGYFYCPDISANRHVGRGVGVFMDAPLHVLGIKVQEKHISNRSDERECLVIPVGPACTIMMRFVTEKYSKKYGRVYHSRDVTSLPYGCRLGDRSHLRWYAVGAGPWEASTEPPKTLVEVCEAQLQLMNCTASAERDSLSITSKKGLASVKLRNLAFEAGWSGWSPHLIISGQGKRITTCVRTHSLTHLVDLLRRIRDNSKVQLDHTIQEVASLTVMKEVLIGPLLLARQPGVGWAPPWKLSEHGFTVAHFVHLPREIGVRDVNLANQTVGILISRDTEAVYAEGGEQEGVWNLTFRRLDAGIESEKLLVGPTYEGFVKKVACGRMQGSLGTGSEMDE